MIAAPTGIPRRRIEFIAIVTEKHPLSPNLTQSVHLKSRPIPTTPPQFERIQVAGKAYGFNFSIGPRAPPNRNLDQ